MSIWQKKITLFTLLCATCVVLCSATDTKIAQDATKANLNKGTVNSNTPSPSDSKQLKVGIVSFKICVEQSKLGKQEQANFEVLKKQMESVLAEKEKTLNDMASKFNDADYLDSLSPEAETELKRKFRALNQEISQQQNQYMQTLQQTNFKVVQKLQEEVTKASEAIAKSEKFDLIINDENTFYHAPHLNISSKVIALMDRDFEKNPPDTKDTKDNKPAALPIVK
jgi:outer membrane protein